MKRKQMVDPAAEVVVGLPFIVLDSKTGKYHVAQEATDFIRGIPGPLAVVSIVGKYRTGKSWLVNQVLLDAPPGQGFGVGNTVNACTKGLVVANKILKIKQTDGSVLNTIVLDTEGIGALDANSTHDSRVFALSLLLSSILVYNSMGPIDEDALENISLVTNLTKHLRIRATSESKEEDAPLNIEGDEEIRNYFPTLLWILRDFTLKMVTPKGDPLTSDQYLDQSLAPRVSFGGGVEADVERQARKNKIRGLLRAYFPERSCVHLVRPCVEENDIQELDMADRAMLRPEFVSGLAQLRHRLIKLVKGKLICGKPITGTLFLKLCNGFVDAINNNAIPAVRDVCDLLSEDRCREAMDEALKMSEKRFGRLPEDVQGNGTVLGKIKDEMIRVFDDRAFGDKIEAYREKLEAALGERIHSLTEGWKQKQLAQIQGRLCEVEKMVKTAARWDEVVQAYKVQMQTHLGTGSGGEQVAEWWVQEGNRRVWEWAQQWSEAAVSAQQLETTMEELRHAVESRDAAQQELQFAQARLMEADDKLKTFTATSKEVAQLEAQVATLGEKLADAEGEYKHLMAQNEVNEKALLQTESLQAKCTDLELQLSTSRATTKDLEQDLVDVEEEFKRELGKIKQETVAAMRDAKEVKQKERENAAAQLQQLRQTMELEIQQHKKMTEAQQVKLNQSEQQLQTLRQKNFEDAQAVHRAQREASEKELASLLKLQQAEAKLEAMEQRLVECQKKLAAELQQRAADKTALLEMKTLHQKLARFEAQNQSLRENSLTTQEILRQALHRANTLERQLKDQERKQEVAAATAQMVSARHTLTQEEDDDY